MSQEEELSKWLRCRGKTFQENLIFAVKSWQSVEFTLSTKYEIILQWVTEQNQLQNDEVSEDILMELLRLRAQPGLITQKVKKEFVEWFLKQASEISEASRKWCNLLYLLVQFEILQDLFRMDYELQCRVYGEIFRSYEKYLLYLQQSENKFLSTFESEFFASVLKDLKEIIKGCGDVRLFEKAYTDYALPPMSKVLLILRSFKVDFFEELLDIEGLFIGEMKDEEIINRVSKLVLPIRLLCIECAIVKRRGCENFFESLLNHVFYTVLGESHGQIDSALSLTLAAFVIEMFGRHSVNLHMQMNENITGIQFLGKQIFSAVKMRKELYFKEILMLLCATLRLNPLILEHNIFEITAWIMLAPKSGNREEKELFEEYLVLLMDMFRRLSRAEKFVIYLLKAVNEYLKHTDLYQNKKRKACCVLEEETPTKMNKVEEIKINDQLSDDFSKSLDILFKDFFRANLTRTSEENSKLSAAASFSKLQGFWPSNPVGLSFSKIITGLVSKPSLTIWKSLLYALRDLIESLQSASKFDEKSLFQLEFHTALLTQYFAGCKLAEQSEKFLVELNQQRKFTSEILKLFGQFLLTKEHEPRTMSAFLELTYFASNFEILLTYYCPDGCTDESLQPLNVIEKLHSFLTTEEWKLLQQRVLNFGKSSCKYLLHRLKMQKAQASFLLLKTTKEICFKSTDPEILNTVLDTSQVKWYLNQLPRSEKISVVNFLIDKPAFLSLTHEDLELLELVSLAVYENICKNFFSKKSLLKSLSSGFDKVRQCVEITACELLIKELFDIFISRSEENYNVEKISTHDIKTNLDILSYLPMGQLRRQRKTIIFVLHLALFCDLKATEEEELAIQALEILKDLLHFGQQVLIFKFLPTSLLLKLLPPDSCWELYEFLFSTIKNGERGCEQFLQDLAKILHESHLSSNITDKERKILLAAIETLSSLSGPNAKNMKKYLNVFLEIFSEYIKKYFSNASGETLKRDKKFVQKTLAAFAPYASAILAKAANATDKTKRNENSSDTKDFMFQIDEDFRRINKIYIGHSMDYRNPHAVRLMQVTLNHRELLHLDQDEIEFVLTNFWAQINDDIGVDKEQGEHSAKTKELAIKMIIGNKTNEDLLLILKSIANNLEKEQFSNILCLLTLIAQCPFSTIKGAIFNEQYKHITFTITLGLPRNEQQHTNNNDLIMNLLNCHKVVLDNKMIPISVDTMDSILSFLMDINIKKFLLNDKNINDFHALHVAMIEVCSSLVKHRHVLLMDRVPQYMHIFKDLLQAIVWYKSERQKDTALPINEIDNLSELAVKMEALMHLIAQHKVAIKRVAPFVLTFVINLMVANKRPTTLYNKVKRHIENICYELVGICDHRVGRFILRCSNEAGRQLYEVLVKDYQKYHKFKGKV